jgi:hypothetical protein
MPDAKKGNLISAHAAYLTVIDLSFFPAVLSSGQLAAFGNIIILSKGK